MSFTIASTEGSGGGTAAGPPACSRSPQQKGSQVARHRTRRALTVPNLHLKLCHILRLILPLRPFGSAFSPERTPATMTTSITRLGRTCRLRALVLIATAVILAASGLALAGPAGAAGETVNIWLTSTSDSGGRNVTRGLQEQTPVTFAAGNGSNGVSITVNENNKYQQFVGAGASMTDTAGYLLNSSGALSASTRSAVMTALFSPTNGIGLDFLRNPMGASDLARFNYTYDSTCCDLNDFSISHDLADVLPLTRQAQALNPALKIMAVPWTAPPWMKDNNAYSQGWLQSQYYGLYAQYFVKYIQAYQAQGVHIDYVSPQNEPTCCSGYPSLQWNESGLDFFTASNLLPAFHAAGLSTKVLIHDWNWDGYDTWAAPLMNDTAIRNDSLFGGIAWHGYSGNVSEQTT